jgi:hypothetical protein
MFEYTISNTIQLYTVYLYLETALRVSCGTSTHHQERIRLYLQYLVFVELFESYDDARTNERQEDVVFKREPHYSLKKDALNPELNEPNSQRFATRIAHKY